MRRSRKPFDVQASRGFKSLPLRSRRLASAARSRGGNQVSPACDDAVTLGVAEERCPSCLRSATGNRVRAERCVAGSNPALSATPPHCSQPHPRPRSRVRHALASPGAEEGGTRGKHGFPREASAPPKAGAQRDGEGGIRTLDGDIHPHNALAGRRLQPLGHFSGTATGYPTEDHPFSGGRTQRVC